MTALQGKKLNIITDVFFFPFHDGLIWGYQP